MLESKISVIIPTFNRSWCIERAIKSVLNQDYPQKNYEIIIVDDGSTDDTEKIVKKYVEKKKNIFYYKFDKNRGVNFARNFGFSRTKGDILVFLDSDDELTNDALKQIEEDFSISDADVIAYNCIDSLTKKTTSNISTYGKVLYEDLACQKINGELFQVIRRRVMDDGIRFPEFVNGVEAIFWFEVWKKYNVFVSPKALRIYHTETPTSIMKEKITSSKALSLGKARKALIERFGEDMDKLCPFAFSHILYLAGLELGMGNKRNEGLSFLQRSIKIKKSFKTIATYIILYLFGSKILRVLFSLKRILKEVLRRTK